MTWIRENLRKFHGPTIPRKLHIITGDVPPDYVFEYISKWKELMPDWEIRHWRDEHVTEEEFPPDIVERIKMCEKGAQRADIMRYFIIEKYGGFYADSDVKPHRSLEPLRFMFSDVILCHDNGIEWEYIINAFFGASPNHPIMKRACELCRTVSINSPTDISHETGPRLLGVAVSETRPADERKYTLLPTEYLYVNHWNNDRFGQHLYAHSWK